MTQHQQQRWCEQHPLFSRLYVPVVITMTLAVQLWQVFR